MLSIPFQEAIDMHDDLRGSNISLDEIRQPDICDNSLDVDISVHNFIDNNVDTQTDTEIVHIKKKAQNECAVMVNAGKRSFKALWDSDAEGVLFHMSVTTKFHQNSNQISSQVTLDWKLPMAHLLETKVNVKSPSKLVKKDSDSHCCVQINYLRN